MTDAVEKMLNQALTETGQYFWWISPTYAKSKEVVEEFTSELNYDNLDYKWRTNERTLTLKNRSVIAFRSASASPDTLRGFRINGVVVPANVPQALIDSVRTCLTKTNGWIITV